MVFETYIINLDKDFKKYNALTEKLKNTDISFTRFDAIYGNIAHTTNKYDNHISPFIKPFIPNGALGCGLSHYVLANEIYNNTNDNEISLILEDDVIPQFKSYKDINNVIDAAPKDWEVILLYGQGICNYKNNKWDRAGIMGSTAAYLINKKGIEKLYLNQKLYTHVDTQRVLCKDIIAYRTPKPYFLIDDTTISSTSTSQSYGILEDSINSMFNYLTDDILDVNITGHTATDFLKYKQIRIPGIKREFDCVQIISFIIGLLLLFFLIPSIILRCGLYLCTVILSIYIFLQKFVYTSNLNNSEKTPVSETGQSHL